MAETGSLPIERNLIFRQDADWRMSYTLETAAGVSIDTTNWDVKMQIRGKVGGSLLDELTIANGRVTVGGTGGAITLHYPKVTVAALSWLEAVYDIRETPPGGDAVYRFQGSIVVVPMVTRG